MFEKSTPVLDAPIRVRRVVGRVGDGVRGPTLVVMTGIHGNEHAGVDAARRVLEALSRSRFSLRGELIVLGA